MRAKIITKDELLAAMQQRPELTLEFCRGTRDHSWWWLRKGKEPVTVDVHARAAMALRRSGKIRLLSSDFTSSRYGLAP